LFPINALTASTEVLIPLQAHYLALQGVSKLLEVIDTIRKRVNPGLRIGGVFITGYDSRKVLNRTIVDELRSKFSGRVFSSMIRDNVALGEAPISGEDIFRYAPSSHGAEDYGALCDEILGLKETK
jgi:chromosome partitioning protein